MEHLRIQTTSNPYREIELRDGAEYVRHPDLDYDARVRAATGVESVYARARRRVIELTLDGLSEADAATLRAIHADRQQVYLESNIGEHTKIYSPLERSRVPMIGGTSGFARATVATYLDDDGSIKSVASGVQRFEDGFIGKGILLEPARTNYFYPSHGSAGDTIWSIDEGAPTINWDANVTSNIDGAGGTVRIDGDAGESVDVTITFPDATSMAAFVYMRGRGLCSLVLTAGGAGNSGGVTLTMDWQRAIIEGKLSTAAAVTLQILILEPNTTIWLSGHQLENGKTITSYIPTTSAAATRNIDQLYYLSQFNYIEGSIAMWVRWPRRVADCTSRYLFNISDDFLLRIDHAGQIYWKIASGVDSYWNPSPMFDVGEMVHIACAWKDGYAALIVNGVAHNEETTDVRNAGSFTTYQLYRGGSCPHTVIDDVRIDNRYVEWRSSENGEYDKWANAGTLKLMKLTQGRLFRIHDGELKPKEANPSYFDGSIKLIESNSDTNHTIGAA